jgi:hypothetical protein
VHILFGFSALLVLAGLAALFSVMKLDMRPFGRAAFGMVILGNLLMTGIFFFIEAGVLPVLARNPAYQPLLSQGSPLMSGGPGTAIAASMAVTSLGFLLLSWHLLETRTISLPNAILFIGAPLMVFSPPLAPAFETAGGVLLGTAIAWLGISVRLGLAHKRLESRLRVQDECLAHLGHA